MTRHPPDILITTPESLYLMLTSQAREIFAGTEAVIIDEIHAVAQTKRGAHLAITLERLESRPTGDVQRIGLSATQNPLEEVGRFMVGPKRTCHGDRRGRAQAARPEDPRAGRVDGRAGAVRRRARPVRRRRRRRASRSGRRSTRRSSSWSASTARRSCSSTTAAAPSGSRSGSTSCAQETGRPPGDRPRPPRLAGPRGAARDRGPAQGRRAAVPGGHLQPRARHRHGRRRPRAAGRVAQVGHRAGCSGSAAPATTSATPRKGRIFPKFRADLLECAVVAQRMREGQDRDHRRAAQPARRARPADRRDGRLRRRRRPRSSTTSTRSLQRTYSFAELSRAQLENVLDMLDGRYPSEEFGELRPRIVWDRVAGTIRARKGARALAITNAGTIPDRGLFCVNLPDGRRVGELDEEMVYEARPGPDVPARRDELADRGHHARPRDRLARARRPRRGAVLARRRRRPAARAGRGDRRVRPLGGRAGRRDAGGATSTSTTSPPRTCSRSCASSRTPPASSRATARS